MLRKNRFSTHTAQVGSGLRALLAAGDLMQAGGCTLLVKLGRKRAICLRSRHWSLVGHLPKTGGVPGVGDHSSAEFEYLQSNSYVRFLRKAF